MGDKRKKHAPGFKAKVAIDALRERESIREISTRYQIHATQVSLWKSQLQDGATGIFEHPADKRGLRPDSCRPTESAPLRHSESAPP